MEAGFPGGADGIGGTLQQVLDVVALAGDGAWGEQRRRAGGRPQPQCGVQRHAAVEADGDGRDQRVAGSHAAARADDDGWVVPRTGGGDQQGAVALEGYQYVFRAALLDERGGGVDPVGLGGKPVSHARTELGGIGFQEKHS